MTYRETYQASLDDREAFDLILMIFTDFGVLVPETRRRVLANIYRALKPGGRLVLVDMLPHDRAEYRQEMGHVWLGFEPDEAALHYNLGTSLIRTGDIDGAVAAWLGGLELPLDRATARSLWMLRWSLPPCPT